MASIMKAPKGTQDILPPESRRWSELETRIRSLAQKYGYGEARTPLFEAIELFQRGVGQATDIVDKEMYAFKDKGGRSLALRPEWTAPIVRAALEHQLIEGETRLFYIGPIFRYERPQKGRYRQSHQFGVECFGAAGAEADAEVISLAWALMRKFNLSRHITLNINTIGDRKCRTAYRDALVQYLRPFESELSPDSQVRLERNPLRILDSKNAIDLEILANAPSFEGMLCEHCVAHFADLRAYLAELMIPFVVNPRVVRGLDYYNRTVFEITSDALGAQNTICGGGRYDELVKDLGGPPVPAVGFAMGMERLLLSIDELTTLEHPPLRGLQLIALGNDALRRCVPLIARLRKSLSQPVFADYSDRKLKTQLKIADQNGARYSIILGSDELSSGMCRVRDLQSRQESDAFRLDLDFLDGAVAAIKDNLRKRTSILREHDRRREES
jgi:histidyl-tRNA synthetase